MAGFSVRLLVAAACTRASELFGFSVIGAAASREGLVLLDEGVFDFLPEAPSMYFW